MYIISQTVCKYYKFAVRKFERKIPHLPVVSSSLGWCTKTHIGKPAVAISWFSSLSGSTIVISWFRSSCRGHLNASRRWRTWGFNVVFAAAGWDPSARDDATRLQRLRPRLPRIIVVYLILESARHYGTHLFRSYISPPNRSIVPSGSPTLADWAMLSLCPPREIPVRFADTIYAAAVRIIRSGK